MEHIEGLITKVEYLNHPKVGPYASLTVETGQEDAQVILKGIEEKHGTKFSGRYGIFAGEWKGTNFISDNDWYLDENAPDAVGALTMPAKEFFAEDPRLAKLTSQYAACIAAAKSIDEEWWVNIASSLFNKLAD